MITPDVTRLKENLHKTLPEENGILITSDHDHITLSGTASNANNLNRALSMAEAYAPKKVLNFLKIYPEPPGGKVPSDMQTVTIEVIKGTTVNAVKF